MITTTNEMSFSIFSKEPKKETEFKDTKDSNDPKNTNVSPFQKYADEEGFILVYVERSYMLLSAINCNIPNYYHILEAQARQSPQMAKELYMSLREGMELTAEQFALVHCQKFVE